jgi:potassium channel subfamily K
MPSLGFTIRECVVSIGAYLLMGVLAYSVVFEKWSIIDALYFSVTTFTTVGYGDLGPSSIGGKVFTCLFGLGGIMFLGAALASIGANLVEAEVAAMAAARKISSGKVLNVFEGMTNPLAFRNRNSTTSVECETATQQLDQQEPTNMQKVEQDTWKITAREVFYKYAPIFGLLFMGGVSIGRLEGWSWMDSMYYAIITAGTVGYGDFSPHSRAARLLACLFLPVSVAAVGEVLSSFASAIVKKRRSKFYQQLVETELTMEDLAKMDSDKNGQVSRLEYVEFMLVQMKLVEPEVLQELSDQFTSLDLTKSDYLAKADLELMVQLREKQRNEV